MASEHKTERNAGVAAVAMFRAFVTEGMESLRSDEIAGRIGYKNAQRLDEAVLRYLVEQGWASPRGPEFALTALGRQKAEQVLYGKDST